MLKVAQVKPPGYPHADCFDHVARALRSAAQKFPEADGTVVIGANLLSKIPAGTIIWNFEQVELGSAWMKPHYVEMCRDARELWDYSPANVDAWRDCYGIEARLLPVAYDPAMTGAVSPCASKLDRARFYGSLNDKRNAILNQMPHLKLQSPIYGAKLDQALSAAPCVLNIHFYEAAIFEIVRCSYLFANAVPALSEQSADQSFYNHLPDLFHGLDQIRQRVESRDYPDGREQRRAYMGAPHLTDHLDKLLCTQPL